MQSATSIDAEVSRTVKSCDQPIFELVLNQTGAVSRIRAAHVASAVVKTGSGGES